LHEHLQLCRAFFAVLATVFKLLRLRPDVVIGSGGQVAYPTCMAAALLRKPLVLLEPNVFPGLVNSMLNPFACLVLTAFKTPARWVPPRKCAPAYSPCPTITVRYSGKQWANC
jgi:UDP-N-acetylglucosamine--N-acetylmuramyl-(pentapeptide) pyrophosphoryl-undecaprenol N-acetylglucosamine transferase